MRGRKFIIGCLRGVLLCGICGNGAAASDVKPVTSFRSELWRMEFQEQEQEQTTGDVDSADAQPSPQSSRGSKFDDELVKEGQLLPHSAVPGETDLKGLSAETPFAEWQIDQAAQGEADPMRQPPTAWTLSRAVGGRGSTPSVALASGPSVITYLVAIVAGIVMIGAFFSGRE